MKAKLVEQKKNNKQHYMMCLMIHIWHNGTLVSGNAGDEKNLYIGGRKKKLSISLNFLNKVYP